MRSHHAVLVGSCALVALGGALGCAAPAPSVSYVVTRFVHERPEVVEGAVLSFGRDVDSRDTTEEGPACTDALDFTSPITDEEGVDNQYAAALVGWLDAALGDTTTAVNEGPRWIVDVTGIDDLRDTVTVTIFEAAAGQDVRGATVLSAMGVVHGEWLDVLLPSVPMPMGEAIGTAEVQSALLRIHLFPRGELEAVISGELSGVVTLETVLAVSQVFEPTLDIESTRRMAMPDVDADDDGVCEAVSLGIGLTLTRIDP